MIDEATRVAILRLSREGHGTRAIARALGVGRGTVKRVLRQGCATPPRIDRATVLDERLEQVRALFMECRGNRIRVHEELAARHGVEVSYAALTAFCRRHGIGRKAKAPVGEYRFAPGEEMQHDTSPHEVVVGERRRRLECASLVLSYSRFIYARCYPSFTRFEVRLFLTSALTKVGGVAERCVIDNTSVVLAGGSGADARISREMDDFATHYGFTFAAHEVGHADRKGRVERTFRYIETNFYAGRTFDSLADLNEQLEQWCERANRKTKWTTGATPVELFAAEAPALRPLPIHVPEPYRLHIRRVDTAGFVCIHTNRYSVPVELIGRSVDVRESEGEITVYDGPRLVATHAKRERGACARARLAEHHGKRYASGPRAPTPEERRLRAAHPSLNALVSALNESGAAVRRLRRLHRMWLEYPEHCLVDAVAVANEYGLTDLNRIERMVLRSIAGDFFRLPVGDAGDAAQGRVSEPPTHDGDRDATQDEGNDEEGDEPAQ